MWDYRQTASTRFGERWTTRDRLIVIPFWAFMATVLLGAGVFFLDRATGDLLRQWQSARWPTVDGLVTTANRAVPALPGTRADGRAGRPVPPFEYAYNVAGHPYTAQRVKIGEYYSMREDHVTDLRERYPTGSTVSVAYDPDAPEEAVLEPGWNGQAVFFAAGGLLCGSVFTLLGGSLVWLPVKRLRRNRTAAASHA